MDSIFSNSSININTNGTTNSRLLTSTTNLRNSLVSRNLYNNTNEYPLNESDSQKIVNSISSVLNRITYFDSNTLKNSLLGNLVSGPKTPLTEIGIIMLGNQLMYNFQTSVEGKVMPQVNVSNLFDGNPNTSLVSLPKDFSITNNKNKSTISSFLSDYFNTNLSVSNPFQKNPTNEEYLKNTGNQQIKFLVSSLNKNIYKTNDKSYYSAAKNVNTQIKNITSSDYINTSFYDQLYNPHNNLSIYNTDIQTATATLKNSYISVSKEDETKQEYASNEVDFGKTKIKYNYDSYDYSPNIDNQIVWGKDGITSDTNNSLGSLRGSSDISSNITPNNDLYSKFGVKTGLLEYTRNLLNASKGQLVDQTRKRFKKSDGSYSYNGSDLWESPSNSLVGKTEGLRQHTILDQYDRFAKAIRFDGNKVYNGGNPNSVVYKSVLPRIAPMYNVNSNTASNKNLMFAIENLAVGVFSDGKYGIIDDEYGTQIPITEVGQFGGRLMWFPPYDIKLNEVASAKFDSTNFVGRSEPVYNYMYSERSATLSFKLLIDYPPQINNLKTSKDIADFFAFGLNNTTTTKKYNNNAAKAINDNLVQINNIEGYTKRKFEDVTLPSPIAAYFPAQMPIDSNDSSIFNLMYNTYDTTKIGDNSSVFPNVTVSDVYNYSFFSSDLDTTLLTLFTSIDDIEKYNINIVGNASNTDFWDGSGTTEKYNQLGTDRAQAFKNLIIARMNAIYPSSKYGDLLAKQINVLTNGNGNSTIPYNYDINASRALIERNAVASFSLSGKYNDKVTPKTNAADTTTVNKIKESNQTLNSLNNNKLDQNYYVERDKNETDSGKLENFKAIERDYLYPTYHSQTPEDFHKRLTFLQQCTRQGSSIQSNSNYVNNVEYATNSIFGKQPICILRVGDFFYTKIIIETVTVDYANPLWDVNPEGFGMQPMIADVTLQIKVIGGQSLKGPIDALQNAVSFNYYANSNFSSDGMYQTPSNVANQQDSYNKKIVTEKQNKYKNKYIVNNILPYTLP